MRFASIRKCSLLVCERGAAAAEMALVLPFLIVLLFGSVELGHYFYVEHQVVKGVRDGARYASRQPFSLINCTSLNGGVVTKIKNVTRTGRISGGTERVPGWTDDEVTVTVSCPTTAVTTGIYAKESNAPRINVVANVNYQSLFGGIGVLTNAARLRAQQQAAVMGL